MRSSPFQKEKINWGQSAIPQLEESPIIFYDGDCGLCQRFVQFVYNRDRRKQFRFASLQGKTAETYLAPHLREQLSSMVLSVSTGYYCDSTAALRILRQLGGVYSLADLFFLVPSIIRDSVYRWIARNRHRVIPGPDTCIFSTKEDSHRFLP